MGKVVKFVGRALGGLPGFATGGMENAMASLPLTMAALSQNPFVIAAAVGSDLYRTFAKHGGPTTPNGAPTVFRQAISDSFIVYGRRRVGGLLVFFHSRKVGSTHYRYFVIAVAGHHCQGNPTWMLGDEEVTVDGAGKVTSGAYADAAWLWFQHGDASETANAAFVAECDGKWTADHKGNGTAAIYAKFKMTDAVVEAGMPNITAVIDGKDDILDPRDASTGYSRNAPLCFYDWMALPREEGGFGAYPDEIPDDDWISAQANVSDEEIEGEERYAIDAVITTGAPPSEIRDAFILNCAGTYTFSEGKHLMRVGYWVPPTETLSEGDFAGPLQVSTFLTNDQAATEVQITYVNPDQGYQGAPAATQRIEADDVRQVALDLAFITSKYRSERVGAIALKRANAEKSVSVTMNIMGLRTGALDTVQLGTERYGLSNYAWVVTTWGLAFDPTKGPGVALSVREENEAIYADPEPVVSDTVPAIAAAETIVLARDMSVLIANSWTEPTRVLTVVETAGSVTLTVDDHDRVYPDGLRVPITGDVFTGLDPATGYVPYYDDITRTDTAPTIAVTNVVADAQIGAEPGRHALGRIKTPESGSGDTFVGGGVYPTGASIGGEIE
ncbi:MAG: hypothetical protein QOH47_803 [Sphingomonadales bacterium]|jgi:hypothetical protein|nr:hypothetical protein [Sphingomonadales bacterium]